MDKAEILNKKEENHKVILKEKEFTNEEDVESKQIVEQIHDDMGQNQNEMIP